MSNPTRVVPHIEGRVTLPSTGMGSPKLAAQAHPAPLVNPGLIRSSGRITAQTARAAARDAAKRLRSNQRRVLVVG